jgi:DnaJ-class molecular chaperone
MKPKFKPIVINVYPETPGVVEIALERVCPRCNGNGEEAKGLVCGICWGKGIQPTATGGMILEFLKRHTGEK